MKRTLFLSGFLAFMLSACNTTPTKPAETAPAATEVTVDSAAQQLDSAKTEIDKSVEELDKLVKDLN